jgi:uncharacterized membrane protein
VEFEPVNGHTLVKLAINYDPPGGPAGEIQSGQVVKK